MVKPQQPELHRTGHGASDPASTKTKVEVTGAGGESGATGPIPEDNLPGHHPEHEQDKPVRRFRARARAVVAEAEAEAEAQAERDRRLREHEVEANGMTFRVLEAGPEDGDAVVLLHGFPQSADSWSEVIHGLADGGYRVIAPDQRGYCPGARPGAVRAYRIPELVADVEAIADTVGVRRFHLVGHDWGGAVAWALAASRPQRLRRLTVVSTPHPRAYVSSMLRSAQALRSAYVGFFSLPVVPEAVLRAGHGAVLRRALRNSGLPRDFADEYAEHMLEPGALSAALNWYRAAPRSLSGIGKVGVPTLYVWSTGDVALGRAAADATKGQVTGPYRFEVLDGVSHWIPETAADRLLSLLEGHLD